MHIVTALKSKIHSATVTDADVNYEGSISIDRKLMKLSGIFPYEKVLVANYSNGKRFETYAIPSDDSGEICVNGAASLLVDVGDIIIIMAFRMLTVDFEE